MENVNKQSVYPMAFACYNKDRDIRSRSSSGGIFYLLGSHVTEQAGIVFGAKWNENWEVVHDEARDFNGLKAFMGSKYVQSNLGSTFLKVKKYLEEGRQILFSGTPCQVAGLKCFLQKDYENLITVDIICHGVPSPKVWRLYLAEIRKHKAVAGINFRDKTKGWRNFSLKIDYASHIPYRKTRFSDMYLRGFLKNLDLRPSCYECRFKGRKHISDITLGDFWGAEQYYADFSDDAGISLAIIQSDRGKALMDALADKMEKQEIPVEIVEKTNSAYIRSINMHPERKHFFNELVEGRAVGKLICRMTKGSLLQRIAGRLQRN